MADKLRHRAEERVNRNEIEIERVQSLEEMSKILHELRVHQVELEMQNEELRRAYAELDTVKARYFDLYDLAPVGYITINEKSLILEVNLAVASMLGVARSSLIVKQLSRFIFKEDQDIYYFKRKHLFKIGAQFVCDLRMVKDNGQPIWTHLVGTVVKEVDGPLVCRIILNDIDERKKAEEAHLAAKNDADHANMAKSEFLSNMSHEIRTPINGMLGFAQLLSKRNIDDKSKEYANIILQSGKALLEIINDILDLSKIEAGKVEILSDAFRLRDSLGSGLKPLENIATEKGLMLHYAVDHEVPDILVGDLGRLMQVLMNLVGNAIKFTQQGKIMVSVSLAEEATDLFTPLRFTIQDNGIGIPKDSQEKIFEPFSQVGNSAHTKYGGTGLGLPISKNLVEMMGGTIRLESDEGYGSTFSFVVPFGVAQTIAKSSPPLLDIQPDRQRTPLNILLVEDNKVNRMWAVEIIQMWGNTVVEAENGQEALEKLRTEKIDFVLMDVCMPVMDGVEATRRIRNGEAGDPAIPIIAMTAYALKGDRDKLLNTGMNDYISKPVDIEELDRVLERVIGE